MAPPKRKIGSDGHTETHLPGTPPCQFTPEVEAKFIATLAEGWSVTRACTVVNCTRQYAYERRNDPRHLSFKQAWDSALEQGTDRLEDEMFRRAHDGTEKPVFYQGSECGSIQEYSDTLAIFLAKGRRPDKYRERGDLALTGPDGAALLPPTLVIAAPQVKIRPKRPAKKK